MENTLIFWSQKLLQENDSGDRRRNLCRRVGSGGGGYGTVAGEEHTACGWVGQAYDTAVVFGANRGPRPSAVSVDGLAIAGHPRMAWVRGWPGTVAPTSKKGGKFLIPETMN